MCLDRYAGLLWSLARRWGSAEEDAEDFVQEVFIDLWKSAARYDPEVASEATFVLMIARRRLIDRQRRRGRRPATSPIGDHPGLASDGAVDRIERGYDVSRAAEALDGLRPEQRDVLKMAVWQGLTHAEIAESTGLPLGTVKTHVRRGLLHIREALGARSRSKGATA